MTNLIEESSFRLEPSGFSPVAKWRNLSKQISRLRCTPLEMTIHYEDYFNITPVLLSWQTASHLVLNWLLF